MLYKIAGVAILGLIVSCGGHKPPNTPPPSPIPSPSPAPAITFPLFTNGPKFVDATGKPFFILGAVECCNAGPCKFDWPFLSKCWIDLLHSYGANYTHMRVGPITKTEDPSQAPYTRYRVYATHSSGRANIDIFNQAYFDAGDEILKYAASKGIVVEVSLIDAWEMKEGSQDGVGNPWCLRYSVNPFNECYANQLSKPPHKYAERLINKVVQEWGDNKNIIWEISNESGVPGTLMMGIPPEKPHLIPEWEVSTLFEIGIVNLVRAAEVKYGYVKHLIGTNSEREKIEKLPQVDYINLHNRWPGNSKFNKPVIINEYPRLIPDEIIPPGLNNVQLFKFALERAAVKNTYIHLWRGDDGEATFLAKLAVIKEFKKTH